MNDDKHQNKTTADETDLMKLIRSLESNSGSVRQEAREKLARIGSPAVEPLVEALEDNHEQVRWEAAKTLVAIADHRSVGALIKHLEDEDFDIRWLAAEALIAIGEPALPELLQALEVHVHSIRLREGAHHVLKQLVNDRSGAILNPVINALNELEPELNVPGAARAAMKALHH